MRFFIYVKYFYIHIYSYGILPDKNVSFNKNLGRTILKLLIIPKNIQKYYKKVHNINEIYIHETKAVALWNP